MVCRRFAACGLDVADFGRGSALRTMTTDCGGRQSWLGGERRVVVEYLRPQLLTWPESPWKWLDALPAQSIRTRFTANAPGAGVDWVATRLDGWPPRVPSSGRRRIADSLLVTATRWTIEQLADAVVIADRIAPGVLGRLLRPASPLRWRCWTWPHSPRPVQRFRREAIWRA